MIRLSVIIPTFNPDQESLTAVLTALQAQTLSLSSWELLVVDNNSQNGFAAGIDLSWHPDHKLLFEARQGLTYSRTTGITAAKGDIVVLVDDDNILDADYLERILRYFDEHPQAGVIGGRIYGIFPGYQPDNWTKEFWPMLAIRDLGDQLISIDSLATGYPGHAPVGAGMAVRRQLLDPYLNLVYEGGTTTSDRSGTSLSSGGDNEIVIRVLMQGFAAVYLPQLKLGHRIPATRLSPKYLGALNYASSRSWIRLLRRYEICPWPAIPAWSLPLRKIRAWLRVKPWQSISAHIAWRGACGKLDGLAADSV